MNVAVTGSNGLIGSRFCTLLQHDFSIAEINLANGIDILERDILFKRLSSFSPSAIFHFAAKTHVDGCEEDRKTDFEKLTVLGIMRDGNIHFEKIDPAQWVRDASAFSVNVVGTKNLVDYAKESGIMFCYISTDFVFDGEKEYYSEDDLSSPINWYGQTKWWGEQVVSSFLPHFLIVRTAYPYGISTSFKKDFVARIIELLSREEDMSLVSDHYMTPTCIDDIVYGLQFLLKKQKEGIFHLVGDSFLSPFEAGMLIADIFQLDKTHIQRMSRSNFFKGKAKRPFQLRLKHDKLNNLGFDMRTFEEGLEEIKRKMSELDNR